MKKGAARKAFDYVRRIFFPGWDRKYAFGLRVVPFLASIGRFDNEKKKILLRVIPELEDDLYVLLIHEIAHHVSPYHGEKWMSRMREAATKALEIGRDTLATKISQEIESYKTHSYVLTPGFLRRELEDFVMETRGKVPYSKIAAAIAHDNGLTRKDLEKRSPMFRKDYELFKKQALELRCPVSA